MAIYFMPKHQKTYNVLKREEWKVIDDLSNICAKIENLASLLEIPVEELNTKNSLCAEVQELLKKYYPDCLLLMFGSAVNGFGMRQTYLDLLFLPFDGYCNLNCVTNEEEKISVPEPSSILAGESSRDLLSELDELSHIKLIWNILKREKKLVLKAVLLPVAILKIQFVNNIHCNLYASNKLVVFTSELLYILQKLDVRVKPLVLTLRYWAHISGFIKRSFFSSYAFTMLVIFFLQNTSPPVLPSVQHMIEISGFSRMIAGWETAFATDLNLIPKSKNTDTTADLLMQFFHFYWNFDFAQYIVSPYKGTPLPIKDIRNSQDKRMANFGVVSVNIQDLFILSDNICKRGVVQRNVFKVSLFTAYQMLLNKNKKFKFSTLFDPLEYDRIYDLQYQSYFLGKQKTVFINLFHESFANICKDSNNLQTWYDNACQTLFDVLQYGLLMECEITDKICWKCKTSLMDNDIESKNETPFFDLEETANVENTPFDLDLLLSFQCIAHARTWIGRKLHSQAPVVEDECEEFAHPILRAEYHISKAILEANPLDDSREPLLRFKCECYKHTSPQMPDIIIILRPLTCPKLFHEVSTFINLFIPKIVRQILFSDT